jgi:N-acyl-D-aspartate/D-glutamate deacylase
MVRRFNDPDTLPIIDLQTREMLEIRGGAGNILFVDQRPDLNGKTLMQVADERGLSAPEAAREILRAGNAGVMNLRLYDDENTRHLAQIDWMMTCTDGRDPGPTRPITHPRAFGSFTKKLKELVIDDGLISLPFAIRSMTGLAADFLGWTDRGYLREGMVADITVLDLSEVQDMATYEAPHQYSEGTVHVLVNGVFSIRDGEVTVGLAGKPLMRAGRVFDGLD